MKERFEELLRWERSEYTTTSPEDFEQRRKEKWDKPGTKNHGARVRGRDTLMVRDEMQKGPWFSVGDEHGEVLTPLFEGRVVASIKREPDSGEDWPQGANDVTITFTDGSQLLFSGWGYDSSGCSTSYKPASGITRA